MSRRRVLVVSVGCAGLCIASACGGDGERDVGQGDGDGDGAATAGSASAEGVMRIPLSLVPVGGVHATSSVTCGLDDGGFFLARDDGGLFAYVSACSHAGGAVAPPDEGGVSVCCLHGSTFDRNGDIVKAVVPGQKPLRHLRVALEGEGEARVVAVYTRIEESNRSARVAVP
jgi:Rieske Fe-S protein